MTTEDQPRPFTSSDQKQRYLTAEEAAAYLGGMNARTLVQWARRGQVPAYPMGEGKRRLWRFKASQLDKWMEDRASVSERLDCHTVDGKIQEAIGAPGE